MAKTAAKKTVKSLSKTQGDVPAPIKATPTPKNMAADAAAPAVKIAEALEEGVSKMTDTVKETVKETAAQATEKATTMFKDVKENASKLFGGAGDMTKDVVAFHKDNFEAVVESGKVVVKGTQEATQRAGEITRKNWDATTAHFKALTGVKSPMDFLKLQGEFAKKQFDGAVADFSKNTEMTVKIAGEVVAPLQNRYSKVAEQVKARMAA
jgi:phasin family protein